MSLASRLLARLLAGLGLVAGLGLAAWPASAQVDDKAWEECKRNPDPDWVVFNCTAVIEGAGDQSKSRRARALVLRAGALVRKKDPERARADLNRAVTLSGGGAEFLAARGDFLLAQGEIEGATADFTAAVEVDPATARAWFGLAGVARQRGDVPGAVHALDKVLAIDPRYPRARAIRTELTRAVQGTPQKSGS